jgi:hypothetical protein
MHFFILPHSSGCALGPGVYPASNRNERQKQKNNISGECGRCIGLTTLPSSVSRLSRQCGILNMSESILKPIWTYGIQLWGTASTSNIEILERFQSKALRLIVDAPWYVPNHRIRCDLHISSVKDKICHLSHQYYARLTSHSNDQVLALLTSPGTRRLCRHLPDDLPSRFAL